MAAEEEAKKGPEEGAEGAEEQTEEESKRGGLGGLFVPDALVRISVGIIVLGAMTVGVFFLITDLIGPALGPPMPEDVAGTANDAEVAPAIEPPGEQFMISDVIINPSGTRGKRFLRLGLALETKDGPLVIDELTTRTAQIRDLIIRQFTARTLDELSDPVVREEIRLSCIDEINAHLGGGKITNIYFTDYVLQ